MLTMFNFYIKKILNINETYKIMDNYKTLSYIEQNQASICRFGDGEFSIIKGSKGPRFQTTSNSLAMRLVEVLSSCNDNTLICIPQALLPTGRLHMTKSANSFWAKQASKLPYSIHKLLTKNNYEFGNSLITRPYMDYEKTDLTYSYSLKTFQRLKTLWNNKKVLIVEGCQTRLGVGNDLFSSCQQINRILCPQNNAWNSYNNILEISTYYGQRFDITLIALGPTATVLAYDLSKKQIQAIDIGHLDIEYEWFLHKANDKAPIKNKYTNETKAEKLLSSDIDPQTMKNYVGSILCDISQTTS